MNYCVFYNLSNERLGTKNLHLSQKYLSTDPGPFFYSKHLWQIWETKFAKVNIKKWWPALNSVSACMDGLLSKRILNTIKNIIWLWNPNVSSTFLPRASNQMCLVVILLAAKHNFLGRHPQKSYDILKSKFHQGKHISKALDQWNFKPHLTKLYFTKVESSFYSFLLQILWTYGVMWKHG